MSTVSVTAARRTGVGGPLQQYGWCRPLLVKLSAQSHAQSTLLIQWNVLQRALGASPLTSEWASYAPEKHKERETEAEDESFTRHEYAFALQMQRWATLQIAVCPTGGLPCGRQPHRCLSWLCLYINFTQGTSKSFLHSRPAHKCDERRITSQPISDTFHSGVFSLVVSRTLLLVACFHPSSPVQWLSLPNVTSSPP